MRIFKSILIFLLCLLAVKAFPQSSFTDLQKSDLAYKNYAVNGGAENGKYGWSETGSGTLSVDTTTKNNGKASIKFISAAGGDYLATSLVACKSGPNCLYRFYYKTTASTFTARVYDNSGNLKAEKALDSNTDFLPSSISFIVPSGGGTFQIRFYDSSTGNTINVDDVFMGANDNIGTTQQAQWVGKIKYGTDCNGFYSNNTIFTALNDTTCTETVYGNIEKIDGYVAFRPKYNQPGKYFVTFNGDQGVFNSSATGVSYSRISDSITDGNILAVESGFYSGSGSLSVGVGLSWTADYSANGSYYIQTARQSDTGSSGFFCTTLGCEINVYFYPDQSLQTVRSESANAFSLREWSNVSNCIFSGTGGNYLTDSDCTTATNTYPTGANNADTNNYYGIVGRNLKANGVYKVTVYGIIGSRSSSVVDGILSINDGTINKPCISYHNNSGSNEQNQTTCIAYFSYPSFQSSKTFRAYATGPATITAEANSSNSLAGISIEEVFPTQSMPQIVNLPIVKSARIGTATAETSCTSNPCTVFNSSGGTWISNMAKTGTGTYSATLVSGRLPSVYNCQCSTRYDTQDTTCTVSNVTSTTFDIAFFKNGSLADGAFTLTCTGNIE